MSLLKNLLTIGAIAATAEVSRWAFSSKIKKRIDKREGSRASKVSEMKSMPLEYMHVFHGIDHEDYGFRVTVFEHFVYHNAFKGNARAIGLSEQDNNSAIASTWRRCEDWYLLRGYELPDQEKYNYVLSRVLSTVSDHCNSVGIDDPTEVLQAEMEA